MLLQAIFFLFNRVLDLYRAFLAKPQLKHTVHRHQNEHVHSNLHPAVIHYVQFTVAKI